MSYQPSNPINRTDARQLSGEAFGSWSATVPATVSNLPLNIIARWAAADWDDDTMTASAYRYEDADTREPLDLTEDEAGCYTWGPCQDDLTGGSQGGVLRSSVALEAPQWPAP